MGDMGSEFIVCPVCGLSMCTDCAWIWHSNVTNRRSPARDSRAIRTVYSGCVLQIQLLLFLADLASILRRMYEECFWSVTFQASEVAVSYHSDIARFSSFEVSSV